MQTENMDVDMTLPKMNTFSQTEAVPTASKGCGEIIPTSDFGGQIGNPRLDLSLSLIDGLEIIEEVLRDDKEVQTEFYEAY